MLVLLNPYVVRKSAADPGLDRRSLFSPVKAVDLLRKTMAYDPKNRLMPDELLRHRWFRRTPPAAVSAPAVAITGA